MSLSPVLLSLFHPFPTISLALPSSTPLASLPYLFASILPQQAQSLSTKSGKAITSHSVGCLHDLSVKNNGQQQEQKHGHGYAFVELRLVPKVVGGKGGFGSQLRAAGGRMSSQKSSNKDACRDLNGRRLSTIKQAQKLAAQIASEPERKATAQKEAQKKLESLHSEIERLQGLVSGSGSGSATCATGSGSGGGGSGSKRRLDDADELERAKEDVEKVRSAVAEAMLKKRKRAKAAAAAVAQASNTNMVPGKLDTATVKTTPAVDPVQ